jgi:AraC family transcriptional activator of mtrCDE
MDFDGMTGKPLLRISPSDLDSLLTALEVQFIKLSECLVSPGWRLEMPATDAPGIHYNLGGPGRLVVAGQSPIALLPHTLVIVPPRHTFQIEAPEGSDAASALQSVDARGSTFAPGALRRFVAGEGEPRVILVCGYFRASYGASIDLFGTLAAPIVEQFGAADQLDHKLKAALAELVAQEVGMGAMTTALLKQVLVALLRRSLSSLQLWVERFPMFGDPHIARAFADMVAQPGAPHSVLSLAQSACLSRSAFMARFTGLFGRSPMVALRELRMRQAAVLLAAGRLSVDQVARSVGYESRSSFLRAFHKAGGIEDQSKR